MSIHDRWGGKRSGEGRRWEVRWRDRGQQRKRRFGNRQGAEAWNATVTLRPDEGRPAPTIAELHPDFTAAKSALAATTRRDYDQAWTAHVKARWGEVPVDRVKAGDVQAWLGDLQQHSQAQARKSLAVLSGIMRLAALNGHVDANPCSAVKWPAAQRAEVTPLELDEIQRLATACTPHHLFVWVLATLGPRFGEGAGFQVGDLDVKRSRLRVARSITTVGSALVTSQPKWGSRRDLPVPVWLLPALATHALGRDKDEPLFMTRRGNVWRQSSWKRVWRGADGKTGALKAAGLPMSTRVHDLRHTAAVRMLEAGTPARAVQRILGHKSLSITLDLYGRWERTDLDAAVGLLDAPSAFSAPSKEEPVPLDQLES